MPSNSAKLKFRNSLGLRTVIDISKRRKRGSKKPETEKTAENTRPSTYLLEIFTNNLDHFEFEIIFERFQHTV